MIRAALLALALALGGGAPYFGLLLDGATAKAGNSCDPDGSPSTSDAGNQLDPNGAPTHGDLGTSLDPNG